MSLLALFLFNAHAHIHAVRGPPRTMVRHCPQQDRCTFCFEAECWRSGQLGLRMVQLRQIFRQKSASFVSILVMYQHVPTAYWGSVVASNSNKKLHPQFGYYFRA
jgi:hypothetical protein